MMLVLRLIMTMKMNSQTMKIMRQGKTSGTRLHIKVWYRL